MLRLKKGKYTSRKRLLVYVLLAVLSVLLAWMELVPLPLERQLQAVCRVRSHYTYVVALSDSAQLRFSPGRGWLTEADGSGLQPDSACASGCFVSPSGHMVTTAGLLGFHADSIGGRMLRDLLQAERERLDSLRAGLRDKQEELDYYARKHSVVDDGYNEVMDYRDGTARRLARVDSLLQLLEQALAEDGLTARLQADFTVGYGRPDGKGKWYSYMFKAVMVHRTDSLLLLRSVTRGLPEGAARMVTYLRPVVTWGRRGLGCFGVALAPDAAPADSLSAWGSPCLEGSVAVNCFGKLCGLRSGGRWLDRSAVSDLVYGYKSWPVWALRNLRDNVRYLFSGGKIPPTGECRDTLSPHSNVTGYATVGAAYGSLLTENGRYAGRTRNGLPDGWGTMYYADSTCYEGEWQTGRRCGAGCFTDSVGRLFSGLWAADTLAVGTLSYAGGLYRGHFNAALRRHGDGSFAAADGSFYTGEWMAGNRHGFGMSVSPGRIVHCGVWKNDRFQGERLVYTSKRVYGIDIARYQHEIGKRVYPIDWQKLRIRSFGTKVARRVQGEIGYPVSFVYIKATQGETIRNKYYAADVAAARKRGVAVGAYHFFSTRVSGKAQARYFLKHAAPRKGDLPPVLDVEPYDSQIVRMGGAKVMFREIKDWMDIVERATGTVPVLYVSQNFVNKYMSAAPGLLAKYKVWIARYGEYKPYVRLLYWQLSPEGRVDGIHGEVDINVYNGTHEQFVEYLRDECVKK
ncbi:MAG: glycosyl hydrolase family 25 [Bacteroidaceae bacterium]|nr:glycosyl hydrolase family 25 [Bacteroidaceae bacterium]